MLGMTSSQWLQPGMGHDGDAAGMMNQVNRFGSKHLELRHPCRAVLFKKPFECFVQAAAKPRFDEGARNVGPAR